MIFWHSIQVLETETTKWFAKLGINSPRFELDPRRKWPGHDETCDVVISRYPEQILASHLWPDIPMRLWAMCHPLKKIVIATAGAKSEQIGVLDRYQIFPCRSESLNLPKQSESWSLVYSGRINREKGFLLFLRVASHLQQYHKMNVQPVILGILEKHTEPGYKKRSMEMTSLLSSLFWTKRPLLWLNQGPYEWMNVKIDNPVYFNFSVFAREDFAVSAQQANSLGWPLLLSDWGAHKDIREAHHFSINSDKILSDDPKYAFDIAKQIALRIGTKTKKVKKNKWAGIPVRISKTEVMQMREELLKYGFQKNKPWPKNFSNHYLAIMRS